MERLLRPLNRKRNKSGDSSPRRGRGQRASESSRSAPSTGPLRDDGTPSPSPSSVQLLRTSSLPALPEHRARAETSSSGIMSAMMHPTGAPAVTVVDSRSTPEPSPLGDRGNMSTDVSDSFKRAFQEMATEREGLRKTVDTLRSQEQILDDVRKEHIKLKENLEEARAECEKERGRADSAIKSASSFQADIETLRATVSSKSKEIDALKTEIASCDKKSVAELMRREKATEASMLRKAREIEALNKKLESSNHKCADAENKFIGLQKTAEKNAKRTESLELSLKGQQRIRTDLQFSLKKSEDELGEKKKEVSDLDAHLKTARQEVARMNREMRAMEKALDASKGHGNNAASRISDLERQLSLRTDELKASESASKRAEEEAVDAIAKLRVAEKELKTSRDQVTAVEEATKKSFEELVSKMTLDLSESKAKTVQLELDLKSMKGSFEKELISVRASHEKELTELSDKGNVVREELANAKLAWGRQRRDFEMKIDQAEDAVCAKDRELRAATIKVEDAKSNAEDVKWHLDRSNKKLADAREAAEEAEEEHKKEVAHYRSQVSALQASVREAEKTSTAANLSVGDAKEQLNRELAKSKELETKVLTAEDAEKELKTELDSLRSSNDGLKREIELLKETISTTASESTDLSNKSAAVALELREMKEKLSVATASADGLRSEVEESKAKAVELEKLKDQLELEVSNSVTAKQELQSSIARVEELKTDLKRRESEVQTLQDKVSSYESTAFEVKNASQEQSEQFRVLQNALRTKEKDYDQLFSSLGERNAALEASESESETLRGKVVELSELIEEKSKSSQVVENEVEELRTMLTRVQSEKEKAEREMESLGGLSADVEKLKRELSNVTVEKESVENDRAESIAQLEIVRTEKDELSRSRSELNEQIEVLEKELERIRSDHSNAENHSREISNAFDITKTELARVLLELEEAKESIEMNKKSLIELENNAGENNELLKVAEAENERLASEKTELLDQVADLESKLDNTASSQEQEIADAHAKSEAIIAEREELLKKVEEDSEIITKLNKEVEEAKEESLTVAKEMADTQQLADEAQSRASEIEEELVRLSNELQQMEWNLNEESVRADNAEATVHSLREQGRSIYSRIEEFGEEAESRVLAVEGELEGSLQEVDRLQSQIAEYEEEVREARESVKEMRKEIDEARAQSSALVRGKETAEHRLDMAKQEAQFYNTRIQKLEADNLETCAELEKTRATLREIEHELRKAEARQENDKDRLRDLSQQVERLRVSESKYSATEVELVRLRAQVEQAGTARKRLEMERDEAMEYRRDTDRRHGEEIARLMAERASFAESARKAQTDLEIHQEQMGQFRNDLSSTGSGRMQSERSIVKNSVAMGATAVAGGVGLMALKILTRGGRD